MKFVSSEDARFLVNDWKLMAVSRVHKGDTSVRRKNIFRVHSVRTKELLTWKYYRAEREKWEWCTGCAIKIAFIYWSHRCDVTSGLFLLLLIFRRTLPRYRIVTGVSIYSDTIIIVLLSFVYFGFYTNFVWTCRNAFGKIYRNKERIQRSVGIARRGKYRRFSEIKSLSV